MPDLSHALAGLFGRRPKNEPPGQTFDEALGLYEPLGGTRCATPLLQRMQERRERLRIGRFDAPWPGADARPLEESSPMAEPDAAAEKRLRACERRLASNLRRWREMRAPAAPVASTITHPRSTEVKP